VDLFPLDEIKEEETGHLIGSGAPAAPGSPPVAGSAARDIESAQPGAEHRRAVSAASSA
jgi:hypothetical protein